MAAEVDDSDGVKCKQTANDGKENKYLKSDNVKDDPENKKESIVDKINPSSDVAPEAEERFRVDRKTLENLLKDDNNPESTGNNFFQRIEHATNTTITWPSKLKIGAKSKKDPYIKVAGLPQDRQAAKQMVLSVMDTKSSRVTLKMDVSFTDHSHIIGKGGNTIKKVMQDTKCHIHFPDSNRTSSEKSNQVSIAGPPFCVESARRQIRELLPIVLKFEIPSETVVLPDSSSPVIVNIAQTHNVTISFQQNLRSFGYIGCVKGLHSDPFSVRDSVLKVLEHLTGTVPVTVQVTTQMEVDPKHHEDLNGPNQCNLKKIQLLTGARIMFPSAHDPNARKSTVTINGSIESTVTAKVYLLQFLPLILMFDIRDSENEEMLELGMRNELADTMNVMINLKAKPKQFCKSIIVKGYEKDAANIYKTRLHLIGEDPSSMPYLFAPLATLIIPSSHNTPLHLLNGMMNQQISNNIMNKSASPLSPPVQSSSPLVHQAPESSQKLDHQYLSVSPVGQRIIGSEVKMMKRLSVDGLFGFGESDRVDNGTERRQSLDGLSNSRSAESILDALKNNPTQGLKDMESLASSGSWSVKLPTNQSNGSIDSGLSRSQEDLDSSVGLPLTSNLLNNLAISRSAKLTTEDYELRKKLARDAMHSQVQYDRLRIPTNAWAGFGFSNSMPGAVIKELRNNKKIKRTFGSPNPILQQHSPTTSLNSSGSSNGSSNSAHSQGQQSPLGTKHIRRPPPGLEDSHPSSENSSLINNNYDYTSMLTPPPDAMLNSTYAHAKCIADLFSEHGLENYIEAFEKEEVDVATFMTLTDEDLKEIGVSTMGARKKMARLMKELQAFHHQQSLGYTPRIPSPLTAGMPPLFPHRPTHNFDMAAHSLRW